MLRISVCRLTNKRSELMTDHPPTKPRKERKENADMRRQQLLDATWRSIAEHGLSRTTLATVAAQAGLSQGVAVFYFKSKAGLLSEALLDHYARYQQNWQDALAGAGDDHVDRLIALIRADFAPAICNPESLSFWFAYWGEQKFTPKYAEILVQFDAARSGAMREACAALMPDASADDVNRAAEWIDTFSDGYWQRMHVAPDQYGAESCMNETLQMAALLVPQLAARITSR